MCDSGGIYGEIKISSVFMIHKKMFALADGTHTQTHTYFPGKKGKISEKSAAEKDYGFFFRVLSF